MSWFESIITALLTVAFVHASIASLTPWYYRRKSWGRLSANELKVKQGTASLENRADLFIRTFFISFFTYQVYLLALLLGSIGYGVWRLAA